jgi:isoaspartyl peptidase/L-asparaginase-like protein (Ntn-hydrolase superfamily)
MADPIVIATWPFGRKAVEVAIGLLKAGQPGLDAAIAGAEAVEDDPRVDSVGFAGIANAIGNVSLDACVMDGRTLLCGAVAGLENIRRAAAVARKVMEKTPHVLIVGEGAKLFAVQNGFPLEMMHTPESIAEWYKRKGKGVQMPKHEPGTPENHDTVTVLARDTKGHLAGVCTTSGLAHKLPGRVGDSPLIGAGLYVDDQVGAAGATGVGEEIIRVGGSFLVVEFMRGGKSPQEACELAIKRVNANYVRRGVHPQGVAFLAMDRLGRFGAAGTVPAKFQFAVGIPEKVELLTAKAIAPQGP